MKEIKDYNNFNLGIMTNVDPTDLPDAAVYSGSKNFHIEKTGKLTPLRRPAGIASYSKGIKKVTPFTSPFGEKSFGFVAEDSYGIINRDGNNISTLISPFSGISTDTPISIANTVRFPKGTEDSPTLFYYDKGSEIDPIIFHSNGGRDSIKIDVSERSDPGIIYLKIFGVFSNTLADSIEEVVETDGTLHLKVITSQPLEGYDVGAPIEIVGGGEYTLPREDDQGVEIGRSTEEVIDGEYTIAEKGVEGVLNYFKFKPKTIDSGMRATYVPPYSPPRYSIGFYLRVGYGTTMPTVFSHLFYKQKIYDIGNGIRVKFDDVSHSKTGDYWAITSQGSEAVSRFEKLNIDVGPTSTVGEAIKINISPGKSGSTFTNDKSYYYACSIEYQDYQNSPLAYSTDWRVQSDSDLDRFNILVEIDQEKLHNITRRGRSINIWRASSNFDSYTKSTYYTFVKNINFDGDLRLSAVSGKYYFKFEDFGDMGASYEAMFGVSDNDVNTVPNYTYAAFLNNYLFVADISHTYLFGNANSMLIARSQLNAYDTFDLTKDILKLPFKVNGIKAHNGKIIAIGESQTAIINPDLFIEDIIDGVGGREETILSSRNGLFIGDANGLYLLGPKGIEEITVYVKDMWQSIYTSIVSLSYDNTLDAVIVMTDSSEKILLYYPELKAWSTTDSQCSTDSIIGAWVLEDGKTYFGLEGGTSYKAFVGEKLDMTINKPLFLESPSESKKWYSLFINGEHNLTNFGTTYSIYSEDSPHPITNSDLLFEGEWIKAKGLVLNMDLGVNDLENFSIVYRRLKSRTVTETRTLPS